MKFVFLLYYSIVQITTIYAKNSYLGCFIDQIGARDLNLFIKDYEQLTPTQCIHLCQERNFPYAGIQYGSECRCGHYYGRYGQVSDAECIYNCSTLEKCGGDYRNSIYNVFNSMDTRPTDSICENHLMGYQGCFYESRTWKIGMHIVHSIEQCIQNCAMTYNYAGIMNGKTCYCGNKLNLSSSNENLCNIQCRKNSAYCCGGLHVISVYNIKNYQSSLVKDLFQTLNRVKRDSASNNTTYFSAQTTETNSALITITSISTASVMTSSLLSTSNAATTNHSSTDITQLVSVTSNTSNSTYTSVVSNVTSMSSSNSVGTLVTISYINSSIASTQTAVTNQITNSAQLSVTGTSNSSAITDSTTTVTTVPVVLTTTAPAAFVISTIIIVPLSQNFTPTDNSTRESVRLGLVRMVNLGFTCLANPSNSNCTQLQQRRKRQLCSTGYGVNLVSDINGISTSTTGINYQVDYTVTNLCSPNTLVPPVQVKAATDVLTSSQVINALRYNYQQPLIQSKSINTTQITQPDQKLWIIGAVLGPVAFVLLLICVFCYLHFKCRPRPGNRTLATNVSKQPPISSRTPTYKPMTNEPMSDRSTTKKGIDALVKPEPISDRSTTKKGIHALVKPQPISSSIASPKPIIPIDYEKDSVQTPRSPVSVEMPLDEIRHQNDVERWRNKLRLKEKFQPSDSIKLPDSSAPNTSRPSSSHYDNKTFQHDIPILNIQPVQEIISPRRLPPRPEIVSERSKLHRLLDDVLDKAESDESYNPDSESERRKRRRQRRRIHLTSDDQQPAPPMNNKTKETPHVPIIAQVTERPDPSIIRLHHNPYEAGDRAHDLAHFKPVELQRKYSTDKPQIDQYPARSNPPLFFDESNMADRASTAINAYANSKRISKSRLETDHEAMLRFNDGRIDRRQHPPYNGDPIYNDRTFKDQIQVHKAWVESDGDNDPLRLKDYQDELRTAKKSASNTKNIISSIHDELAHMNYPSTKH